MNISTKTVTTKVHTGSFSADEIKAVALSSVTKQAGVADTATIASSKVDIAADGSVTVEIVETVADAPAVIRAEPGSSPSLHSPSFVRS